MKLKQSKFMKREINPMKKLSITATLFAITLTTSLNAFSFGDAASALSTMTAQKTTTTKTAPIATQPTSSNALVGMLSNQLGISDNQAAGGVGSILSYAQSALPSNDYTKLASAVPDASSMLSMAPQQSTNTLSSLGNLAGGASSVAGMAGLASQFSSLGLDSGMVSQFIPIIMDYFKQSGSNDAMGILSGLFSK